MCIVLLCQIRRMRTLSKLLSGNVNLRSLFATGCSCMEKDTPDLRVKFLKGVPRVALQGFQFVLNGAKVVIDERLEAVRQKNMPLVVDVALPDVRPPTSQSETKPVPSLVRSTKGLDMNDENLSRLKLSLELEEAKFTRDSTEIRLCDKRLEYIADLVCVDCVVLSKIMYCV